tara:strand:+ start:582 stop:926 length:345 start_codon:yes stop_codon:yes gene_type:complete
MSNIKVFNIKMDATKLLLPTDNPATVHRTHMFIIANLAVMIIAFIITIGWIIYADSNKKWPFAKYIRTTGPRGAVKMFGVDGWMNKGRNADSSTAAGGATASNQSQTTGTTNGG